MPFSYFDYDYFLFSFFQELFMPWLRHLLLLMPFSLSIFADYIDAAIFATLLMLHI